ncbi:histidine kinase dimerization/phosphoacceptor domain -containing protein [Hirschia litorea]|uniref:Histidine kinase dimerization/phosphoacceptor domain -containing protein n=1 Tax=Hirschia litorea TaxID=1199156 RepID=A0ABW2IIM9_9PROT
MIADSHPKQAERLAALRSYGILDTPREADFDDIVDLASQICGTSISVINLIDADRQWFKAEVGLGVRETPLATSICSHIILEDDFVEIPDTLEDCRTGDNPLCLSEQGLRFYAGALLKTSDGLPIGTLCVLDNEPRKLNDFQKKTLNTLAKQVMRELELRMALQEQDVLRREMDHRVKNSLQTVSSLVRLYKSQAHPDSADAFDAVARKVEAISLLHEELHQTTSNELVPMQRFIHKVVDLLQASAPENVTLEFEADTLEMPSESASGIAMIVSEFVANSIKHAFPDDRDGIIKIVLKSDPALGWTLECCDNGIGVDGVEVAPNKSEGLGLKLINAVVMKLKAKVERDAKEDGYHMVIMPKVELVN